MKIFVGIKQVPDTEAALTVKDGCHIDETNIKWIINPYDEYAIEEALKLKENNPGSSVTAITCGPARTESSLRSALAMGVDHATHIESDDYLDHKVIARALANALKKEEYDIIFMGKQAIDDDSYLTHVYLAEYLDIPVATNVISFQHESGKTVVEREIDEGDRERIELPTPCIVAATKGLNTPRYASLMGIMKAKKIPINKLTPTDLGLSGITPKIKPTKLSAPPEKPEGKIIEGEPAVAVKTLVRLLKDEAQVL